MLHTYVVFDRYQHNTCSLLLWWLLLLLLFFSIIRSTDNVISKTQFNKMNIPHMSMNIELLLWDVITINNNRFLKFSKEFEGISVSPPTWSSLLLRGSILVPIMEIFTVTLHKKQGQMHNRTHLSLSSKRNCFIPLVPYHCFYVNGK